MKQKAFLFRWECFFILRKKSSRADKAPRVRAQPAHVQRESSARERHEKYWAHVWKAFPARELDSLTCGGSRRHASADKMADFNRESETSLLGGEDFKK